MMLFHYKDSFKVTNIPNLTAKNKHTAFCYLGLEYDCGLDIPNIILHKGLINELALYLIPTELKRGYYIIVREHRMGKTTLVQHILHHLKQLMINNSFCI